MLHAFDRLHNCNTMSKLVKHVTAVLEDVGLDPQRPLLVAISGGPDSLALLHVLCQVVGPEPLIAAHLNHGLRSEAAAEAAFVADVCAEWGVACEQESIDINSLARGEGWTLEEAGRNARYAFLAQTARRRGAAAVLTAHHRDDQAETVLLHLLRGSGLDGLQGMAVLGSVPGDPELVLLRPLLAIGRDEIEAYCRANALEPRRDPGNGDPAFTRNRIRQDILPRLAAENPNLPQALADLAEIASADVAHLEEQTAVALASAVVERGSGWLRLDRALFADLPLSLQRRVLRRALHLLGVVADVGFATLEQARQVATLGVTGAQSWLPGDLVLRVRPGQIELAWPDAAVPVRVPQLVDDAQRVLSLPGELPLADGWRLTAEVVGNEPAILQNTDPWRAFVDVGAAQELLVRPRREGERFRPLGMAGSSMRLKDLMISRKIDQELRARWPLVTTAVHPVWLVGHHIDERARVTAVTTRVILLRCTKT